jgi:hypothetical protein
MSTRWVAVGVASGALALAIFAVVIRIGSGAMGGFEWADLGTFLTFALVGSLLVAKLPRNPVGWLLVIVGIVVLTTHTADAYASGGATPFDVPGGPFAQWVAMNSWPYVMTALAALLLVFPSGGAASRRWTIYLGFVVVLGILVSTVNAIIAWPDRGVLVASDTMPPGVLGYILQAGALFLLSSIAVAAVGLVLRYRRARGVERAQLKLFALAMLFLVVAIATGMLADVVGVGSQVLTETLGFIGLIGIPVSIAVAVTRYRLYDVDRLVSRTVSYGLVTLCLVGLYAAGVIGLGWVVRAITGGGGGDLVVAASTLLVAAAFRPVRRRVQSLVDRRFNRAGYDAQRTVEAFAQRLRDDVDLMAFVADLRGVAATALQPRHVSIWVADQRSDEDAVR